MGNFCRSRNFTVTRPHQHVVHKHAEIYSTVCFRLIKLGNKGYLCNINKCNIYIILYTNTPEINNTVCFSLIKLGNQGYLCNINKCNMYIML